VLATLLAACGEEEDSSKAGDIIKARVDNQFEDGKEAEVTRSPRPSPAGGAST